MADKKTQKPKQKFVEVVETSDDYGNFGQTTDEENRPAPRDRRQQDRRKADERTKETRRELGDRRNTYHLTFSPTSKENLDAVRKQTAKQKDIKIFKNEQMTDYTGFFSPSINVQALRMEREIARRSGELKAKIKSRKGGLLGLGIAVGTALMEGKRAYDESKETQ